MSGRNWLTCINLWSKPKMRLRQQSKRGCLSIFSQFFMGRAGATPFLSEKDVGFPIQHTENPRPENKILTATSNYYLPIT